MIFQQRKLCQTIQTTFHQTHRAVPILIQRGFKSPNDQNMSGYVDQQKKKFAFISNFFYQQVGTNLFMCLNFKGYVICTQKKYFQVVLSLRLTLQIISNKEYIFLNLTIRRQFHVFLVAGKSSQKISLQSILKESKLS